MESTWALNDRSEAMVNPRCLCDSTNFKLELQKRSLLVGVVREREREKNIAWVLEAENVMCQVFDHCSIAARDLFKESIVSLVSAEEQYIIVSSA